MLAEWKSLLVFPYDYGSLTILLPAFFFVAFVFFVVVVIVVVVVVVVAVVVAGFFFTQEALIYSVSFSPKPIR